MAFSASSWASVAAIACCTFAFGSKASAASCSDCFYAFLMSFRYTPRFAFTESI